MKTKIKIWIDLIILFMLAIFAHVIPIHKGVKI